ncbi:8382_t:CDS:10, partial [Paraglomus occultum]
EHIMALSKVKVVVGIVSLKRHAHRRVQRQNDKLIVLVHGKGGIAFAYKDDARQIEVNDKWPSRPGYLKTNTALLYDESWNVLKWGAAAYLGRPRAKDAERARQLKPVELFKLHLGDIQPEEKPQLPPGLDFKKAISDYLAELWQCTKEILEKRWPTVSMSEEVLKILTIPAEFNENTKAVMRNCAANAGIIDHVDSPLLEFTTEPEAAAIDCLAKVEDHYDLEPGDSFLIVDCGGGTIDLTIRTLLQGKRISEITERTGGFFGSTHIDRAFSLYLARKVNLAAFRELKDNYYYQYQQIIRNFCEKAKIPFNGDEDEFEPYSLDIDRTCPALKTIMKQMNVPEVEQLEDDKWTIDVEFEEIKEFFDKTIVQILGLIEQQLASAKCRVSAMFLVGGFGESQYLLSKIRENFSDRVPTIAVPAQPIIAIARGAVAYGLDMRVVQTRVLKWTYGIEVSCPWQPGDPPHRRSRDGLQQTFQRLAKRGTQVSVDEDFPIDLKPTHGAQTEMHFPIYYTSKDDSKYCDDLEMRRLGLLTIDLPATHDESERTVEFRLIFGQMELKAAAKIKRTDRTCHAGIDDPEQDYRWAVKLFILCLVISSTFVYNIQGIIERDDIGRLFLMSDLSKHISPPKDTKYLPHLVILLRDFHLKVPPDIRGHFMNQLTAVNRDAAETVKKSFADFDVFPLSHPCRLQEDLHRLSSLPPSKLDSTFIDQAILAINSIFASLSPKYISATTMTGLSYAKFLEACIDKMNDPTNSGELSIPSEYESVAIYISHKVTKSSLTLYKAKMNLYLRERGGTALIWEEFIEVHAMAFKDAHLALLKKLIGTAAQIKKFEKAFFDKIESHKKKYQKENSKGLYKMNEVIAKKCWHRATSGLMINSRMTESTFKSIILEFESDYGLSLLKCPEAAQVLTDFRKTHYHELREQLLRLGAITPETVRQQTERERLESELLSMVVEGGTLRTNLDLTKKEAGLINLQFKQKIEQLEDNIKQQDVSKKNLKATIEEHKTVVEAVEKEQQTKINGDEQRVLTKRQRYMRRAEEALTVIGTIAGIVGSLATIFIHH